ncbi:MAG: HAD-IB family phosphatase [Saprospiraceae bacterium]
MNKTLALFDFDGTLTWGDTMLAFFRHALGLGVLLLGLVQLPVWLLLGILKLRVNKAYLKERLLRFYLGKKGKEEWEALAHSFADALQENAYRVAVYDQLRKYQKAGDRVCIVSASLDVWLDPIWGNQNVELICTQSNWQGSKWMGFDGANCNGDEKVRRIKALVNLADYEHIVAYGNSRGDAAMLKLANEAHWI